MPSDAEIVGFARNGYRFSCPRVSSAHGLTFLAFTDDGDKPFPLANQVPEPSTVATLVFGTASLIARRRLIKAQE